jgi:hypothetical protein
MKAGGGSRNPPDDDYTGGLEKKQCVVWLDYDMYQVSPPFDEQSTLLARVRVE